jgi:hypothetical protein
MEKGQSVDFAPGAAFFFGQIITEADEAGLDELRGYVKEIADKCTIPPLITSDFENGCGSMVKALTPLPYMMGLGATDDAETAYDYGKVTALEGRTIGANWSFSPVSDEAEDSESQSESDGKLNGTLDGGDSGMSGFPGGMGGMMGGMMGGFSSGDFTVIGYSSDGAMTAFGVLSLAFGLVRLEWKKCPRDLALLCAMSLWALLGNTLYNGLGDRFFNWFFVVRDPFGILPANVAPFIMPFLMVVVMFGGEMVIYGVYHGIAAIRRSCCKKV